MYFSSLSADIPLMLSGIVAGLLCARFSIGRDFGWALVPALIYLLNGGFAFFRDRSFEMWLIMTGLPSLYAAILCVGIAYWVAQRQSALGRQPYAETK